MKRFTLKSAAAVLAAALIVSLFTALLCPVSVGAAPDPTLFFDLDFTKDRNAIDATSNFDVSLVGGAIETVEVKLGEASYQATGYHCVNPTEFIQMDLNTNAGIADGEAMGKMILDGFTMEIYLQLDQPLTGTAALIGSCYSGGVMLYSQKANSACFFVGSDGGKSSADAEFGNGNYAYSNEKNIDETKFPSGELVHLVGVYNKETNKVQLYINGKLISEGAYGTGPFKVGNMAFDTFGIGLNPSYPSEEIGKSTPYTVLEAKMYKVALSADQVETNYIELNNMVATNKAVIELDAITEPVATEPVATEPVATEPVATEPAATEPVATEPAATEPETETPRTEPVEEKTGCGSSAAFAAVLALIPAALFVKKKEY